MSTALHEFDSGHTGMSTRCNALVLDADGTGTTCDLLRAQHVRTQSESKQLVEKEEIRRNLAGIIGYTCETSAPNQPPAVNFILDRWMQPRLDALVQYVLDRTVPPEPECGGAS